MRALRTVRVISDSGDTNPGFPSSGRQHIGADRPYLGWSDDATSYSLRFCAFAITASARDIASRSSSLCQVSAELPSSNDRSWLSFTRRVSSRSAPMASESSSASAPSREDSVTFLSPSYRDYEPPSGIVETVDWVSIDHAGEHIARPRGELDIAKLAGFDQRVQHRSSITDTRLAQDAPAQPHRPTQPLQDWLGSCGPHRTAIPVPPFYEGDRHAAILPYRKDVQGPDGCTRVSVRRLHFAQLLTGFPAFHAHGSNSSRRLMECPSTMRESTS